MSSNTKKADALSIVANYLRRVAGGKGSPKEAAAFLPRVRAMLGDAHHLLGRTWAIPGGHTATIKDVKDGKVFVWESNQQPHFRRIYPLSEIADEIAWAARAVESERDANRKTADMRRVQEAEEAKEAHKERHARAFASTFDAPLSAKVLTTLRKQQGVRGVFKPRYAHIEDLMAKGYRVNTGYPDGPVLEGPQGFYFKESDLTRTALRYAAYLADKMSGQTRNIPKAPLAPLRDPTPTEPLPVPRPMLALVKVVERAQALGAKELAASLQGDVYDIDDLVEDSRKAWAEQGGSPLDIPEVFTDYTFHAWETHYYPLDEAVSDLEFDDEYEKANAVRKLGVPLIEALSDYAAGTRLWFVTDVLTEARGLLDDPKCQGPERADAAIVYNRAVSAYEEALRVWGNATQTVESPSYKPTGGAPTTRTIFDEDAWNEARANAYSLALRAREKAEECARGQLGLLFASNVRRPAAPAAPAAPPKPADPFADLRAQLPALQQEFEALADDVAFSIQARELGERPTVNIPESIERLKDIAAHDAITTLTSGDYYRRAQQLDDDYKKAVRKETEREAKAASQLQRLRDLKDSIHFTTTEEAAQDGFVAIDEEIGRYTRIANTLRELRDTVSAELTGDNRERAHAIAQEVGNGINGAMHALLRGYALRAERLGWPEGVDESKIQQKLGYVAMVLSDGQSTSVGQVMSDNGLNLESATAALRRLGAYNANGPLVSPSQRATALSKGEYEVPFALSNAQHNLTAEWNRAQQQSEKAKKARRAAYLASFIGFPKRKSGYLPLKRGDWLSVSWEGGYRGKESGVQWFVIADTTRTPDVFLAYTGDSDYKRSDQLHILDLREPVTNPSQHDPYLSPEGTAGMAFFLDVGARVRDRAGYAGQTHRITEAELLPLPAEARARAKYGNIEDGRQVDVWPAPPAGTVKSTVAKEAARHSVGPFRVVVEGGEVLAGYGVSFGDAHGVLLLRDGSSPTMPPEGDLLRPVEPAELTPKWGPVMEEAVALIPFVDQTGTRTGLDGVNVSDDFQLPRLMATNGVTLALSREFDPADLPQGWPAGQKTLIPQEVLRILLKGLKVTQGAVVGLDVPHLWLQGPGFIFFFPLHIEDRQAPQASWLVSQKAATNVDWSFDAEPWWDALKAMGVKKADINKSGGIHTTIRPQGQPDRAVLERGGRDAEDTDPRVMELLYQQYPDAKPLHLRGFYLLRALSYLTQAKPSLNGTNKPQVPTTVSLQWLSGDLSPAFIEDRKSGRLAVVMPLRIN